MKISPILQLNITSNLLSLRGEQKTRRDYPIDSRPSENSSLNHTSTVVVSRTQISFSAQKSANKLFQKEVMKDNPDPQKLSEYIKMEDFKPNKFFSPRLSVDFVTPMWALYACPDELSNVFPIIAELARHPDFDPNRPSYVESKMKSSGDEELNKIYLLETLLLYGGYSSVETKLKYILDNCPNVRIKDAPFSCGFRKKTNMLENIEEAMPEIAAMMRDYIARKGQPIIHEKYSDMSLEKLLELIKTTHFNPGTQDLDGNLIIHAAASSKDPNANEVISLSLERIQNIDIQNKDGKTPAMLAVENIRNCKTPQEKRICYRNLKFILERKPDFKVTDKNGDDLNAYIAKLNDPLVTHMSALAKNI